MRKPLLTLFALIIVTTSFSQKSDEDIKQFIEVSNEKQLLSENSKLMLDGFLYQAEMVIDKLLTFQPENPNYNYRKGFLLLEISKDYTKALPFLLIAVKDTKPHFDAFNTKEKSAPTDAFYHLASCYHLQGDIAKASENYTFFLENTNSKSTLTPITEMKLKQCEQALKLMSQPVNVSLTNVGQSVNSEYPDYSPVISLDGSALYFTSKRPWKNGETDSFRDPAINHYPEDIYVSYMDYDFTMTNSIRLDFCEPKKNEATVGVSIDETRIYIYEDSQGNGGIFYSDFYAQKFNKINPLDIKGVNTEFWESHCYFTNDLSKIFFSSDRPGGFGGLDLYVCTKNSDTSWSDPVNLGPKINSPFDEDAPFVSVDSKMLYYSSNGEKSMGGFDILVSDLSADGNWDESRNVGFPFNSTHDDIFYTTTIDGLRGYMSSDRPDGNGETDIYEIHNEFLGVKSLTALKGLIRTTDNSPLPEDFVVSMSLKCVDCDDPENLRILFPRVKDGIFITDLKPCKTYILSYINHDDKISMYQDRFTTECTSDYREIFKEVILDVENKLIIPVKKYILHGVVADRTSKEKIINAKIEVVDRANNKVVEGAFTDKDGAFSLNVLGSKIYNDSINLDLKISKEEYLSQTFNFSQTLGEVKEIHINYLIEKSIIGIDIADLISINPIYFDFDKSALRSDAIIELNKIVKIMNDNPTLKIEFSSHTDCRGTANYNLELSDRRAKASVKYIRSKITNPKRIFGKGYGENQLVNDCYCEGEVDSNCSEEEHQANRRTEFRIVK